MKSNEVCHGGKVGQWEHEAAGQTASSQEAETNFGILLGVFLFIWDPSPDGAPRIQHGSAYFG